MLISSTKKEKRLLALLRAAMPVLKRAFGSSVVRRWVVPIATYEAAQWVLDLLWYLLKWKAADMLIGLRSREEETAAFLSWVKFERADLDTLSRDQIEDRVRRYVRIRQKATTGSRLASDLGISRLGQPRDLNNV